MAGTPRSVTDKLRPILNIDRRWKRQQVSHSSPERLFSDSVHILAISGTPKMKSESAQILHSDWLGNAIRLRQRQNNYNISQMPFLLLSARHGVAVRRLDLRSYMGLIHTGTKLRNNLGQVVRIYVPLPSASIMAQSLYSTTYGDDRIILCSYYTLMSFIGSQHTTTTTTAPCGAQ